MYLAHWGCKRRRVASGDVRVSPCEEQAIATCIFFCRPQRIKSMAILQDHAELGCVAIVSERAIAAVAVADAGAASLLLSFPPT